MAQTLYIIDGHSQIFRAYYAPFRDLTSPAGEPTRATFVFTTMLLNLIEQRRPDYLVMAMDSPRQSLWRSEVYPQYKAHRDEAPEDLIVQVGRIEQIVRAMGIPLWRGGGQEADDYLASAAAQWAGEDLDVVLVSSDKDLEQALGEHVAIYDPARDEILDPAALERLKGYRPDQAIEIQTLTGDSTDNIPGVKGIGPKTAAKLIAAYGTAAAVVAHADQLTPKQRENVLAFADRMDLTRRLVSLRTDVELPDPLERCRWSGVPAAAVAPIFRELGFARLTEKFEQHPGGGEPPPATATSPAAPGEPTTAADFGHHLVDSAEALDAMLAAFAASGARRLAVDTETTSTRPMWAELVGISLAWSGLEGYYLPVRGPMGAVTLDVDLVRAKLGPLLADPAVAKVGHNLKYDAIVLGQAGMELEGIAFDSYLGAYLLDASAAGKLDNVAMRELNHRCIPITDLIGTGAKAIGMDQVYPADVAVYAAEDAYISYRLADTLTRRLDAEGLADLLEQIELPLLSVLVRMERAGIRLDPQVLKRQEIELDKKADQLRSHILDLAGEPFNPDSPRQLAAILFEKLGLSVLRSTKTGPSTDAWVLAELAAMGHPLPRAVLDYRQLTKLLSTYLRSLVDCIHPRTGRIHASFNQGGTITGRLSSSEPNLQNIPVRTDEGRRIRSAFVPGRDGDVLLSADYSQIELRVLAHFCRDDTLVAAFEQGQDIHRTVAAEVFGVPAAEVTDEQRARAKTVNFGIVYGQTAHGLAATLGIGRGEAQEFITKYKRRFPAIDAFLHDCIEQAKRQGYVQTICRRRRPIADINSRNSGLRQAAERTAINSVVQGSAADMIKLAMVNVDRRIRREGRPSRMLLQIHDELVFEMPAGAVEAETAMIVEEMESAIALTVPVKVDVGVGANWMEAK
ncbi:MAG: DNA polymerase I [Planctomycetes bacterium]|nr:DNA polymerase I [Planctomycetota bacterium]